MKTLDVAEIRKDFPILQQQVYKRPLVYFDNAATTQRPVQVTQTIVDYNNTYNSNIHRGVHYLSQRATQLFEETRMAVRDFINAQNSCEIIFTRGTTESINLVASSFGKAFVNQGDEIIVSEMEHHSNIVPWQLMCEERGAVLKVIPFSEEGLLDLDAFRRLLSPRTRLVAVAHASNALGSINDLKTIIEQAHQQGAAVLVDGAQAISHLKVDVQALDCDFYCFSGHKMYAPMGIGVMFGKQKWLEQMPPYQGGGEMIKTVTFAKTTYNELPFKFEAGTPNVGDALALRTAIDYMQRIGLEAIAEHEQALLRLATRELTQLGWVRIIGQAANKTALISFLIDGVHPYDAGVIIDQLGVAVRTGHHCAQPVMDHYNIPGTIRASFAIYNTEEEVYRLIEAVKQAQKMLH